MEINEFGKSLRAALYDRAKSPFYGTFIITWITFNWRLLFCIFFGEIKDFESRLVYINQHFIDIDLNLWRPLGWSFVIFIAGNSLTILFRFLQIVFNNFRSEHVEKREMLTQDETERAKRELIEYENRINTSSVDLKRQKDALEEALKNRLLETEALQKRINELEKKEMGVDQSKDLAGDDGTDNVIIHSNREILLADRKNVSKELKNFETVEASVLNSSEGSIIVWANVTQEHNSTDKGNFMYILAHAGNNGQPISKSPNYIYTNAWSIGKYAGAIGEWRFWCSNSSGSGGDRVLKSRRLLEIGWHLFSVCWSKNSNSIKFYIDGKLEDEGQFRFWPENIESVIYVGTWPNLVDSHYFNSEIGPIWSYEKALTKEEVVELAKENPYKDREDNPKAKIEPGILKKLMDELEIGEENMALLVYYVGKTEFGELEMGALSRKTGWAPAKIRHYLALLNDILYEDNHYGTDVVKIKPSFKDAIKRLILN